MGSVRTSAVQPLRSIIPEAPVPMRSEVDLLSKRERQLRSVLLTRLPNTSSRWIMLGSTSTQRPAGRTRHDTMNQCCTY